MLYRNIVNLVVFLQQNALQIIVCMVTVFVYNRFNKTLVGLKKPATVAKG